MARLKKLGLSQQTFKALIQTNYAISELSLELLNEGYDYVLTGRFQSDPLERTFSQYRQLSGGRFLVSLQEVLRSESIIKLKSILKGPFKRYVTQNSRKLDTPPSLCHAMSQICYTQRYATLRNAN